MGNIENNNEEQHLWTANKGCDDELDNKKQHQLPREVSPDELDNEHLDYTL